MIDIDSQIEYEIQHSEIEIDGKLNIAIFNMERLMIDLFPGC